MFNCYTFSFDMKEDMGRGNERQQLHKYSVCFRRCFNAKDYVNHKAEKLAGW